MHFLFSLSLKKNGMNTIEFVYWQEDKMWIGYLKTYMDYLTQGNTLEELKENLKDIYLEIVSGTIPNIRRTGELEIA